MMGTEMNKQSQIRDQNKRKHNKNILHDKTSATASIVLFCIQKSF